MSARHIRLVVLLVALAGAVATPALAEKNDQRFQKSSEARKSFCSDLKLALDTVEAAADERAGTKAAKPYAEEADKLWAQGERANCSWTQ